MTEEQYWDKDCTLTKYYREAEQLRHERTNYDLWLQGMYIYDTLSRLAPVLHAFAKKGTKAKPYVDAPYPISQADVEKANERKEKAVADKGKRMIEAFMAKNNKALKERE